tara:strand:- start:991 stop:1323 length:333 start_codon:yes stop_codon:yes gene_type:complete
MEIWWVDLEPSVGAETNKKRPCVILQSDDVNIQSKTVIVAPILPGHKDWPFVVNIVPTKLNKLDKDRNINLKYMRGVDVSRISNKQGKIDGVYFADIERALSIVFDLQGT